MSARKDLGFITWMQMIGCLSVIVGHSYPFVMPVPMWASKLQVFIYDFHMPLFVWCSGYLLSATKQVEKYTFAQYTKRRAIHILIPYIAFSVIGIVPKMMLSAVLNDSFQIGDLFRAFLVPRENIWGHFWFLPMIFALGLIGYAISKITFGGGGYLEGTHLSASPDWCGAVLRSRSYRMAGDQRHRTLLPLLCVRHYLRRMEDKAKNGCGHWLRYH